MDSPPSTVQDIRYIGVPDVGPIWTCEHWPNGYSSTYMVVKFPILL